jgi:beta-glucosidase
MKALNVFVLLLIVSVAVRADIAAVTVPATMVHAPSSAPALGFTGKVEYTLAPLTNDSVFVTLSIIPSGGGTALALTSVTGDVGIVNVNTNTPTVAQKFGIFFEVASPQPGVQYIARVIANAVTSNMQADIQAKIGALSKATRASLCGDIDKFQSATATGVPAFYMNDGPYGWNSGWGNSSDHATCFPACVNEACTWDTALAHLQGMTKAEEWRAKGRNVTLGPGMTLMYHPLCGRSAEYMSEDPYLSGRISAADAMGVEQNGVMPTIKHYACNSVELNRTSENSSSPNERTLQEIFLYNWKPAARVAWAVMASYNKVNGEQAVSNKYILTDVLRTQWGYRSLVMSDWGAAYTASNAVNYGMDLGTNWQAPFDDGYVSSMSGASDSLINMHLGRIMYAHEKLGDMAPGYAVTAFAGSVESAAHKAIVRTIGTNSIVLARNTGNILPLPKKGKTIAVLSGTNSNFGAFASVCQPGIAGSGNVYPTVTISYVQGITSLLTGLGTGASTIIQNPTPAQLNSADYIVVFVGVSGEVENTDRSSAALGSAEGETVAASALAATNGATKTIVVYSGGNSSIAGTWSNAPAIIIAHFPGDQQGASLADVLFGNFNPCGKLSATFAANNAQLPPYEANSTLTYPSSDSTHGYFRVNKLGLTPLFAFGHGLSYTTFAYSNLQIFPTSISAGDRVHVRVTVQNLGTNIAETPDTGSEVVQLYLSMPTTNAALPVRVQDLRGFRKVTLGKGVSTTIDFELTAEDMQVFNPNTNYSGKGVWQVLTGTYGVRVGTSSQRDLQPTINGSFTVQ